MINSTGRVIFTTITETGRYNGINTDETGVYGVGGIPNEITASGGAVAGGDAQTSCTLTMLTAGGALAGGSASISTTVIWTQADGAVAGGSNVVISGTLMPTSGGAMAGGASAINTAYAVTPSGGALAGSAALFIARNSIMPEGGATSGGISVIDTFRASEWPDGYSCTIHTSPPATYRIADRLVSLGTIRRPLSGNGSSAENANMTVTLDNGDGLLTGTFSIPPLHVKATVAVGTDLIFSGTVSQVEMSEQIIVEVQA